jgi:hypothetical protein
MGKIVTSVPALQELDMGAQSSEYCRAADLEDALCGGPELGVCVVRDEGAAGGPDRSVGDPWQGEICQDFSPVFPPVFFVFSFRWFPSIFLLISWFILENSYWSLEAKLK